ncbi:MAG TPA: PilZ domain-containing protein [Verrucomicrobiae bacterium]|nr:PilZ domain-containing protein [Verrucomicrobiae bacterium]
MRQSAAVLCHDKSSLQTLRSTLDDLGIGLLSCSSQKKALELVLAGRSSILIVDFDLPGAEEAIRMASLLPPAQKPLLLAVASRVWPGTGQAFQSGANRILYRPLEADQIRDALGGKRPRKAQRRKSARYEMKTLVYLDLEAGPVQAITLDIGEHGLALQASEAIPMSSDVAFHCVLPGTDVTLHGHADVIWASEHGRAGLFFSRLAPAARKQLQHWLHKRKSHKDHARDLLPQEDERVSFAVSG